MLLFAISIKGLEKFKIFFSSGRFLQKMNNQIELYDYETSDRLVFVHFLEEIEDTKKTFWNYLTEDPNPSLIFNRNLIWMILKVSRSQNNIVELYLLPKNKRANLFFYPDSPVLWFYIHKVDLYQKSGSMILFQIIGANWHFP